jgi:ribosome-associated translation inhibitor RaiA
MDSIEQHIENAKKILDDPMVSSQTRRHIEDELESLEKYKKDHPEDNHNPTHLELYCNDNPDALECKIYEV